MTITATLYPIGAPKGTVHIDRDTFLAQTQGMVGGLIQIIPSKDKTKTLIMNEEGRIYGLEENHHEEVKSVWFTKEDGALPLVGNVIVIDSPMHELDL